MCLVSLSQLKNSAESTAHSGIFMQSTTIVVDHNYQSLI